MKSLASRNTLLMLALTFTTGIVDAVGYLGLDRVFTANMTGNVVLLGMGLMGGANLPVLRPILILFAFALGAAVAGRVLRHTEKGWSSRVTALLTIVAIGVAAVSGALGFTGIQPADPQGSVITTVLAAFMGLQAGAARNVAVPDVSTVVVTSTLVGLAFDSILAGGSNSAWARRLVAVLSILAGAAAGAGLLVVWPGLPLILALTGILAVTIIGHRLHVAASRRNPQSS